MTYRDVELDRLKFYHYVMQSWKIAFNKIAAQVAA